MKSVEHHKIIQMSSYYVQHDNGSPFKIWPGSLTTKVLETNRTCFTVSDVITIYICMYDIPHTRKNSEDIDEHTKG